MSEYSEHHHPFVHVDQLPNVSMTAEALHGAINLAGRAVTFLTGATMHLVHGSIDTTKG